MSFDLFPDQTDLYERTRQALRRGIKRVLVQLPTGGGKTVIGSKMLANATAKGHTSWFLLHRRELVKQSVRTLTDAANLDVGIVAAGFPGNRHLPVQVCSIGTVGRRLDMLPAPTLMLWDECIAGDSVLNTDLGDVFIQDIPASGASLVKSFDGKDVVWRRIEAWRKTGRKPTFEVRLSNGKSIRGTSNHPIYTVDGWINIGEITPGASVLSSGRSNDSSSSEHSSATRQSCCPTSGQPRRDCAQTTPLHKQSGQSTRPKNSTDSTPPSSSSTTPAMGKSLFACVRHASRASAKSINSFAAAALKSLRSLGSISSGRLEWLGGIATTGTTFARLETPPSTLRATARSELDSSQDGSPSATAPRTSTSTSEGTSTSECRAWQRIECLPPSLITSRPACDTSWASVVSVESCGDEDVFDISVKGTRCFFANDVLVHNCHHLAAASWAAIMAKYPDAVHIGLSATPERLDGTGLGAYFDEMVCGPTVRELIDAGRLCDYMLYAPKKIDLSGVHSLGGDFNKKELAAAMSKSSVTGDALTHYTRYARGKRAILFAWSIEASIEIVRQFNAAGISAEHVDGGTDDVTRDNAITRFRRGELLILSNVNLFSEGFDVPAVEAVFDLAPTQSLSMYLQRCGRALRVADGKQQALLFDHAGNSERHGLPDADRTWSLEGKKRAKRASDGPPVRQCSLCFGVVAAACTVCRYCGYKFETAAREIEQVEGELVAVSKEEQRRREVVEQAQAKTLDDLIRIGTLRGMKNPTGWAKHVHAARLAKQAGEEARQAVTGMFA